MLGGTYLRLGTVQMEFSATSLPLNKLCHLRKVHSTLGPSPLYKVEKIILTLQKYYEDKMV